MAKITRKTQKVLGGSSSQNGVFGSAQSGTFELSNDPDDIQDSPAWEQGWNSATFSGQKLPALEEVQGVDYVSTRQLAYILQEGIPEYDSGTEYHENSIVKEAGTVKLYKSLVDDNQGNPLSDNLSWKFLIDLDSASAIPDGDKGDITVSSSGATWTIDGKAVTLSKIQDAVSNSVLLGAGDAGAASSYTEISLGSGLSMTGSVLNAASGGIIDTQIFTSSGTWTKPGIGSLVFIQMWSGGGSGASRNTTGNAAGGGGGGYVEMWVPFSKMASSETITVGTGGSGVSGDSNGQSGGNTYMTIGGVAPGLAHLAGGGGGSHAANSNQANAGNGGYSPFSGGGAASTPYLWPTAGSSVDSLMGLYSATGGPVSSANAPKVGGDSLMGGAGGGGSASTAGGTRTGGKSMGAGNGGAGGANTGGNGTAGVAPGGGGGGAVQGGTSGAGARGEVRIYVI